MDKDARKSVVLTNEAKKKLKEFVAAAAVSHRQALGDGSAEVAPANQLTITTQSKAE